MDVKREAEDICVLCCRETNIFAVGPCDHHVCYECSSRMRVLCQQNECPICRSDMPVVIFSHKREPFSPSLESPFVDKEYMICFEDDIIEDAFRELLEHQCPECNKMMESFKDLEKHVRREHSLNYCNICADNLKLFTFERKCYDRKDLAHHNRKGDLDDTSHRGHPLCQFCQQRFMDNDDRYRHLRKDHFFCHFCDADGRNIFFDDYKDLQDHFRTDHFLCEEDECARERFIGAFRSMLDFKAHKAMKHTRNKTKAEVKQARTLDFEFSYIRRNQQNEETSPNHSDNRRGRNQHGHRRRQGEDNTTRNQQEESSTAQVPPKTFNAQCVEDFPLLSNEMDNMSKFAVESKFDSNRYSSCVSSTCNYQRPVPQRNAKNNQQVPTEDFPALTSQLPSSSGNALSSAAPFVQSQSRQPFNQKIQSKIQPQSSKHKKSDSPNWGQTKKALSMADFPELQQKPRQPDISVTTVPSRPSEHPRHSKQIDESLAQQIYRKCKTKSNADLEADESTKFVPKEPKSSGKTAEGIPLSLLYGGVGKHNPIENQENKNPIAEHIEEIRLINRAYRSRVNYEEETPWSEPAKLVKDIDFPPLESNQPKCPPGFGSMVTKSKTSAPPPGFSEPPSHGGFGASATNISLSSIAQQLNKSNITSSSGPITERKLKTHSYHEPVDFQERNNILIQKITELVGSNNKMFDEFKLLSGSFRKSKISASEYHTKCLKILSKEKFLHLFTELLCLLPDIEKQQELLAVHEKFLKEDSKSRGAVPKKHQVNALTFSTCPMCLQVLAKRDSVNHQTLHKNEINGWSR